jgi:Na+-driven multidrug efflux pump
MSTFLLFFIAVERIGQRELAVANIVRSIYIVMFIPVNSLSTVTNSFVSNTIGAGHVAKVIPIIKRIALLSLGVMTLFALALSLFPEAIISVYTNDLSLIRDSVPSAYVIAAAMLLAAVSGIVFNGVSGTGNTRPALFLELVTLVFYCVYVFVVGMYLKMPVHICFLSEIIYYGLLLSLSVSYLARGNWQHKKI